MRRIPKIHPSTPPDVDDVPVPPTRPTTATSKRSRPATASRRTAAAAIPLPPDLLDPDPPHHWLFLTFTDTRLEKEFIKFAYARDRSSMIVANVSLLLVSALMITVTFHAGAASSLPSHHVLRTWVAPHLALAAVHGVSLVAALFRRITTAQMAAAGLAWHAVGGFAVWTLFWDAAAAGPSVHLVVVQSAAFMLFPTPLWVSFLAAASGLATVVLGFLGVLLLRREPPENDLRWVCGSSAVTYALATVSGWLYARVRAASLRRLFVLRKRKAALTTLLHDHDLTYPSDAYLTPIPMDPADMELLFAKMEREKKKRGVPTTRSLKEVVPTDDVDDDVVKTRPVSRPGTAASRGIAAIGDAYESAHRKARSANVIPINREALVPERSDERLSLVAAFFLGQEPWPHSGEVRYLRYQAQMHGSHSVFLLGRLAVVNLVVSLVDHFDRFRVPSPRSSEDLTRFLMIKLLPTVAIPAGTLLIIFVFRSLRQLNWIQPLLLASFSALVASYLLAPLEQFSHITPDVFPQSKESAYLALTVIQFAQTCLVVARSFTPWCLAVFFLSLAHIPLVLSWGEIDQRMPYYMAAQLFFLLIAMSAQVRAFEAMAREAYELLHAVRVGIKTLNAAQNTKTRRPKSARSRSRGRQGEFESRVSALDDDSFERMSVVEAAEWGKDQHPRALLPSSDHTVIAVEPIRSDEGSSDDTEPTYDDAESPSFEESEDEDSVYSETSIFDLYRDDDRESQDWSESAGKGSVRSRGLRRPQGTSTATALYAALNALRDVMDETGALWRTPPPRLGSARKINAERLEALLADPVWEGEWGDVAVGAVAGLGGDGVRDEEKGSLKSEYVLDDVLVGEFPKNEDGIPEALDSAGIPEANLLDTAIIPNAIPDLPIPELAENYVEGSGVANMVETGQPNSSASELAIPELSEYYVNTADAANLGDASQAGSRSSESSELLDSSDHYDHPIATANVTESQPASRSSQSALPESSEHYGHPVAGADTIETSQPASRTSAVALPEPSEHFEHPVTTTDMTEISQPASRTSALALPESSEHFEDTVAAEVMTSQHASRTSALALPEFGEHSDDIVAAENGQSEWRASELVLPELGEYLGNTVAGTDGVEDSQPIMEVAATSQPTEELAMRNEQEIEIAPENPPVTVIASTPQPIEVAAELDLHMFENQEQEITDNHDSDLALVLPSRKGSLNHGSIYLDSRQLSMIDRPAGDVLFPEDPLFGPLRSPPEVPEMEVPQPEPRDEATMPELQQANFSAIERTISEPVPAVDLEFQRIDPLANLTRIANNSWANSEGSQSSLDDTRVAPGEAARLLAKNEKLRESVSLQHFFADVPELESMEEFPLALVQEQPSETKPAETAESAMGVEGLDAFPPGINANGAAGLKEETVAESEPNKTVAGLPDAVDYKPRFLSQNSLPVVSQENGTLDDRKEEDSTQTDSRSNVDPPVDTSVDVGPSLTGNSGGKAPGTQSDHHSDEYTSSHSSEHGNSHPKAPPNIDTEAEDASKKKPPAPEPSPLWSNGLSSTSSFGVYHGVVRASRLPLVGDEEDLFENGKKPKSPSKPAAESQKTESDSGKGRGASKFKFAELDHPMKHETHSSNESTSNSDEKVGVASAKQTEEPPSPFNVVIPPVGSKRLQPLGNLQSLPKPQPLFRAKQTEDSRNESGT
ncbi:hypothetical protein HDU96_010706 [Phlyctochytrium bullatum]|nr:hypothetical protein HDU96_010706 [Phlyctochytrium bullatum]